MSPRISGETAATARSRRHSGWSYRGDVELCLHYANEATSDVDDVEEDVSATQVQETQ
ncbi:uncharacterized protein DSM5745_10407 [Aspergillus mulundensis]|uniref:Uncharacterized protein n=1 Tax=Aspergillus mulundensis TaxID=1810919 RepID=A0A3D8QIU9_9EURO|nr:hypothetical protein DSM5745_10407 [Aspergillus mulundensis]RDW61735.1 hypothetical protein DSM5745_10407 [Aspergillus mulundensis]